MKRLLVFCLILAMCLPTLFACHYEVTSPVVPGRDRLRLSAFVGVWTNEDMDRYYRFTPESLWFYYNANGQVENKGDVDFDGEIFTLNADSGEKLILTAKNDGFLDEEKTLFHRTDSPSSLISSAEYEAYFTDWYEEANLNGNVLTISEPDSWVLKDPEGSILSEGNFIAYVDETDYLYLYHKEDRSYYARLTVTDQGMILEQPLEDRLVQTLFSTVENATDRYFYFKDKGVSCDYALGSGMRLLRNGGAAYNEAHDYKRMPVTCEIATVRDELNAEGLRELEILVTYQFKHTDLPYLAGGIVYNSVRFSQYDYYTGEVLYLDDSTGDENLSSTWVTSHDEIDFEIRCDFSSQWVYSNSKEILATWYGTYKLVMPADYDGFVICLRPVYNSYSAQISSSVTPEVGTLMMEDIGEDVDKAIFCRIPKFAQVLQ